MVFWWRYNASISSRFRLNISANHSLSFKSIERYIFRNTTGNNQDNPISGWSSSPQLSVQQIYRSLELYLFYTRGIEKYITRNTYMVSFRPGVSNIPVTKNIVARVGPEIYYLKMDDNDGVYLNATLSVSRKNFPLSVSALINKPTKSDIPSEYDFLWNVGLTYTFNKTYIQLSINS